MAYTPGVARICQAIAEDRDSAWNLTIKQNTVAVVSDGTAVLGLGDIGPEAAMPVMEGKALLFKEFGGVDAWPICLAHEGHRRDRRRRARRSRPASAASTSRTSRRRAASRSSARLRAELDIPVFHDDQHGTAIVVLAALLNALRVVGKRIEDVKVVTTGVGAAGVAVTDILLNAGVRTSSAATRRGAIYRGPRRAERRQARRTPSGRTPSGGQGTADDMLAGADVFLGLSRARAPSPGRAIERMADEAIVFAMANPTPEIAPEELPPGKVAVVATGRSDYPNQINNVLAFPGVFRGALDVRASTITEGMKVAAGHAIAVGDRGRRARARVRHPERLQPRRGARGRGGGRRGGGARRRRAPRTARLSRLRAATGRG